MGGLRNLPFVFFFLILPFYFLSCVEIFNVTKEGFKKPTLDYLGEQYFEGDLFESANLAHSLNDKYLVDFLVCWIYSN